MARLKCEFCSKTFTRPDNAKRHRLTCKSMKNIRLVPGQEINRSRADHHTLVVMLQKKDIQVELLQKRDIVLRRALEKKRIELAKKDTELAKTRQELAEKDVELAKRDTALVQLKAEKQSAPVHNHNNYYQTTYAIHMTPWGLDPSSPAYEGSLRDDVRDIRPLMEQLAPLPNLEEFVELDDCDKLRHSRSRQKIIFDTVREGINLAKPRYIVLDSARQKGLFTSPDGNVKVDPRMSLLMEHQRRIAVAATPHRAWYFKKGTPSLARFHDMVATDGRNVAIRIANKKECEDVVDRQRRI